MAARLLTKKTWTVTSKFKDWTVMCNLPFYCRTYNFLIFQHLWCSIRALKHQRWHPPFYCRTYNFLNFQHLWCSIRVLKHQRWHQLSEVSESFLYCRNDTYFWMPRDSIIWHDMSVFNRTVDAYEKYNNSYSLCFAKPFLFKPDKGPFIYRVNSSKIIQIWIR